MTSTATMARNRTRNTVNTTGANPAANDVPPKAKAAATIATPRNAKAQPNKTVTPNDKPALLANGETQGA